MKELLPGFPTSAPPGFDLRGTLENRADCDAIIDVRSPAEFAEDHIPGALNCPVLSNDERHEVGLLYAHAPFEARKLGAGLVAKNIAAMLQTPAFDHPKNWRPLIYCWRGGMRSQSAALWLNLIGWRARYLSGGYKTWRKHVIHVLDTLPPQFQWRVICGATGSGKTRLLTALAQQGEQTLDLEDLAAHRGSVLGDLPDRRQPAQKEFETRLAEHIEGSDPAKVIYVEAESRKIGKLTLPNALIEAMRAAPCLEICATEKARLAYLLDDYAHLGDNPTDLAARLEHLRGPIDNITLNRWKRWAHERNLPDLFRELITCHYDPLYTRSQHKNFRRFADAQQVMTNDLSEESLQKLATEVIKLPHLLSYRTYEENPA
ncbi:MAG: tRNA 2-selenouridine(34) synthase MnmH [Peptococcaceae bacterium]|nr:tRNA 2-selenouridine(34) synthase MnmH [Peptococcaceae bacterium]